MVQKKQNRKPKHNRKARGDRGLMIYSLPANNSDRVWRNFKLRYQVTSTGITQVVNVGSIIQNLFCVYNSSTSVVSLVDMLKVRLFEMWCPPTSSGGGAAYVSNTMEFGFVGGTEFGRSNTKSCTSMGIAPMHLVVRPPAGSTARMWQNSMTNQPWEISFLLPYSTVLDFSFDVLLNTDPGQFSVNGAITTSATPDGGILYQLNFAGLSGFPVLGVQTIS